VSWAELETGSEALLRARILPPESALVAWPAVHLDRVRAEAFRHGQAVEGGGPGSGFTRVHEDAGSLIGVGAVHGGRVQPVRILHADRQDARVLPA
jgi:hypothetical protein